MKGATMPTTKPPATNSAIIVLALNHLIADIEDATRLQRELGAEIDNADRATMLACAKHALSNLQAHAH
jgi:hypothetical protein